MKDFYFIFLLFVIYSVIGWLVECIYCTITEKKITYDRGFLLGPYCPIYGTGGIGTYLFLSKFDNSPIALFVLAAVGASVLEYFTSYVMEKIFNARWWDYSNRKYNVEGRICLPFAAGFGLMALVFVYITNPVIVDFLEMQNVTLLKTISYVLLVIFIIDSIVSFIIIRKLELKMSDIKIDSTSDIDKQIRELFKNYNFIVKKVFKSFPKVRFVDSFRNGIKEKLHELIKTVDKKVKIK